jgi:hypothetical protein
MYKRFVLHNPLDVDRCIELAECGDKSAIEAYVIQFDAEGSKRSLFLNDSNDTAQLAEDIFLAYFVSENGEDYA